MKCFLIFMKTIILFLSIFPLSMAGELWHMTDYEREILKKEALARLYEDAEIFGNDKGIIISQIKAENWKKCEFCKQGKPDIDNQLKDHGINLVREVHLEGHCHGICSEFIKFLTENSDFINWSLQEIHDKFYGQAQIIKNVHDASVLQPQSVTPLCYLHGCECSNDLEAYDKQERCRYYFETFFASNRIFEIIVPDDERDKSQFKALEIYKTLKNFPDKIIFVSLELEKVFHAIVVVNIQGRYFLLDPGGYLTEFRSLEALCSFAPIIFGKAGLRYLLVFDKPMTK